MECPICGAELEWEDSYGTGLQESYYGTGANGIHYSSSYVKRGDIYRCPNGQNMNGSCDSENFSVAGSFYTDSTGTLNEGYPC